MFKVQQKAISKLQIPNGKRLYEGLFVDLKAINTFHQRFF